MTSLDQRHHPGEHGNREQDHGSDQQPAEATICPQLGAALPPGLLEAGVDESALGGVEVLTMRLRPVGRRVESSAAVQVGGVAAARLPEAGGGAELAVQADAVSVLLEPGAQGWPLADQD